MLSQLHGLFAESVAEPAGAAPDGFRKFLLKQAQTFRGHAWIFDAPDFAVTRFDVEFDGDATVSANLPGCVHAITMRFDGGARHSHTSAAYCAVDGAFPSFAFNRGERVHGIDATLSERFCARHLDEGFRDLELRLSGAYVRKIAEVLDALASSTYSERAARIYRDGMATELLALLVAATEPQTPAPSASSKLESDEELLLKARQRIESDFNLELTVELLAASAYMSPSKFKHAFKRKFGESAFAYLQRVRMERAKRLLTESTLSVSEIARQVGYSKPGAFSAAFRRSVGTAPHHVRNSGGA
ncbi:MAG: AraC family transcriptional regulator [Oscillospiraceae bacterium]|jgi:AraC-like DNA-binding protein|nr:AraC family transcriptional regulator [Oscillospiraceae bacterium]